MGVTKIWTPLVRIKKCLHLSLVKMFSPGCQLLAGYGISLTKLLLCGSFRLINILLLHVYTILFTSITDL